MIDLIFAAGLCYAVDGDTLRCQNHPVDLRLWGIDAPETRPCGRRRSCDYDPPAGYRAKLALARLIDRQKIECILKDKDSWGRDVVQCYVGQVDIQCEMLKGKFAVEWLRFSHNYYAKCSMGRQKP